jgi:hypothetical protein
MSFEITSVSFGWRLPNDTRTRAVFKTETKGYDEARDRVIAVLGELQQPLDEHLSDDVQALIRNLVGKWVQIPSEARLGMTLPMKYETLTGKIRFFYSEDPRKPKTTDNG